MFKNKEDFRNDFSRRVIMRYGRPVYDTSAVEQFGILAEMVRDEASIQWMVTKQSVEKDQQKQLFYFSMEFLIGRLLTNNLMNLGVYQVAKEGLAELNIDINHLEDIETDAGLGNGGLGRLAACFLDSLATLGLPGHGNTIRYEYGLFQQQIRDGKQVEVPDIWLKYGNPWEVRKPSQSVDVNFYGDISTSWSNGKFEVKLMNPQVVKAVPYDVEVIGRNGNAINTLRLWKPEASQKAPAGQDFIHYITDVNKICQNVYPDDSTEEGRMLRLKQEYFFVSAGLQTLVNNHVKVYGTLDNLADKVVIQLNDTHPILIIPELMRLLLDDYNYSWDAAWEIVSKTVAYTNHTILQEALEKWPTHMVSKLLPRVWLIIEEINNRFFREVVGRTGDYDLANRVAIIRDGQVHMSHMADATVFSINGVARIHTEILKDDVMKDFYRLYPNKFNNKTNGITHRRWLVYSNPQLTNLITEYIGDGFVEKAEELANLKQFANDEAFQAKFRNVKHERKEILAAYIKKTLGIELDTNSIFDVQAKRLHAYKRQLLNCMHIIYLYQQIKSNPDFDMHPVTFLFAAKAAPSYIFAKNVIYLINRLGDLINNDPEVNKYMKVVFIPNYCVSIAEILMNAADVSEQISTAGKEASGTGNMKLMMNGAITLGTLDGANVEIREEVGDENVVIFGNKVEDIAVLKQRGYSAMTLYNDDPVLKGILDFLVDGPLGKDVPEFRQIYQEILYKNDEYFHLADFHAYKDAQRTINNMYRDQKVWSEKCILNIAASGFFSSDRTIEEYNRDIWHLTKVQK